MGDVISAFSLEQVSRLTGLSQGRLVDWDASDFFAPSLAYDKRGSPYSRIYSFEDVVGLRTLNLLRERVSMQHLKKAAKKLKQHAGKPWSELTFYVLNKELYFSRPQDGPIEAAVSGQYAATIPLESVAEEMRQKAEGLKKRPKDCVGKLHQSRFVMGGEPVIAGTRILASSVQALADAGYNPQRILKEYPDLKLADVMAVIGGKAELTRAA